MIYITGDTHGDFYRLFKLNNLTQDDILIIAGDFGGVWYGYDDDDPKLNSLAKLPYTICFIDGNHENFNILEQYPLIFWNGGVAHKIRDNVLHLMRGCIFTINNQKIFTFGGAQSHDISGGILDLYSPTAQHDYHMILESQKPYRIKNVSWWEQELPTNEELEYGIKQLEENQYQIDYIITHCAPTNIQPLLVNNAVSDSLTDYLQYIYQNAKFKHWYFGHYHKDENVAPKMTCLYNSIKCLEEYDDK